MAEFIPLIMFVTVCLVLLAGFPVAFSLAGTAIIFAGIGVLTDTFNAAFLGAIPNRLYGDMTNSALVAVPLFVFMGVLRKWGGFIGGIVGKQYFSLSGRWVKFCQGGRSWTQTEWCSQPLVLEFVLHDRAKSRLLSKTQSHDIVI